MSASYKLFIDNTADADGRLDGNGFSTRLLKDEAKSMTALVGSSGGWSVDYHNGQSASPMGGVSDAETLCERIRLAGAFRR